MSRPTLGGVATSHTDIRDAFRPVASSVWVVTSAVGRDPVGFTAVSLVSVSAAPPLISFNLSKISGSRAHIERRGLVAAHLLADDQEHLARRFSRNRAARFVPDGEWRWCAGGLPELPDSLVRLVAEPVSYTDAGDSLVVTARVTASRAREGAPLLHRDRSFSAPFADTSLLEGAVA
ncbi:MAG: flavin reductase family protein [Micrococcales bacterium]|nr:flavin reductase family protein [Micrococcales bacterium]